MYQKSHGLSWLRAAGLGGAFSMALTLALCMALAALIAHGALPLEASNAIAIAVCLASSWGGAYLGARRAGERRMPAALTAAGVYLMLMLMVKGLAFRGGFSQAAYLIAAVAIGGVLAGLMAAKKRKRRRR